MSTSRSIRRAIERKQAKQARKEARLGLAANTETLVDLASENEAVEQDYAEAAAPLSRPEINRLNARFSTGPTSAAGKATSSMNALKTGLTGRTILLPDDDASAYEAHVGRFIAEHKPVGNRESELVQSLADARWRLNRIPSLEFGIYALGRIQFAELFPTYDPASRAALIQAHTHLHFQKQLTNLALQETRLRRHFEKDLAELHRLQAERIRTAAKTIKSQTAETPRTAAAPASGFEFSTSRQGATESLLSHLERGNSIGEVAA